MTDEEKGQLAAVQALLAVCLAEVAAEKRNPEGFLEAVAASISMDFSFAPETPIDERNRQQAASTAGVLDTVNKVLRMTRERLSN